MAFSSSTTIAGLPYRRSLISARIRAEKEMAAARGHKCSQLLAFQTSQRVTLLPSVWEFNSLAGEIFREFEMRLRRNKKRSVPSKKERSDVID